MSERNLEKSRGKDTIAELYNLRTDIAETKNLAMQEPDVVQRLTKGLEQTLRVGSTRRMPRENVNDGVVSFKTTQTKRWAPKK